MTYFGDVRRGKQAAASDAEAALESGADLRATGYRVQRFQVKMATSKYGNYREDALAVLVRVEDKVILAPERLAYDFRDGKVAIEELECRRGKLADYAAYYREGHEAVAGAIRAAQVAQQEPHELVARQL